MNKANYQWHGFESRESLAEALADRVADELCEAIAQRGRAIIALSGGSTPKPLFKALAARELDWSNVVVTLVDERWVPEGHELSNASFMQTWLLNDLPQPPRFVPLYAGAANVEASVPAVLHDYCQITQSTEDSPAPFDVVILGMGGDGHTASFFPDAGNVAELVDPNSTAALLTCVSPSTQVERITWSLPVLLNTGMLALHFTGTDKKAVFDTALEDQDVTVLPIRSAIFQSTIPLQVYYAD